MHTREAALVELEARGEAPELLEGDARLEAGERGAEAEVHAAAEGEVLARVAAQVEAVGVREDALVAVRRADQQQHLVALPDLLAVEAGVARGRPRHELRRVVVPQRLPRPGGADARR